MSSLGMVARCYTQMIFELLIMIWRIEEKPTWEKDNIIPVHTKGEKTDCDNYRGITFLPTCHKVPAKITKDELELYIERQHWVNTLWFREGRSTTDKLLLLDR